MPLRKVISGGQTGADQGGLLGARLAGIATGGLAPKGWRTEVGNAHALLRDFGLREAPYPEYAYRTRENVRNSDGTLIIGSSASPGSRLTRRCCEELRRPFFVFEWPECGRSQSLEDVVRWALVHELRTLNVAGNRESKAPGIHDFTSRLVLQLCGAINL